MERPLHSSFRDLFGNFEYHVGRVLLPLDSTAREPAALVSTQAVCLDLARRAALEIFEANGCRQLDDSVALFPTLDALGRLKAESRSLGKLDVVSDEFLEALGRATLDYFSDKDLNSSPGLASTGPVEMFGRN